MYRWFTAIWTSFTSKSNQANSPKQASITEATINFFGLGNQVEVSINTTKIEDDQKWDGLKGYTTNTKLSKEDVIEHYKDLWQIEKAFRVAKTDLQIRPIYHRI